MQNQRRAELLLLSCTVIWGSTFVITKSILEGNSPYFYTAIRFFISALILLLLFPRRVIRPSPAAVKHGIVLGIFLFLGFIFQTVGIQFTTASKSAFFTGLLTIFTPLVHVTLQRLWNLKRRSLSLGNIVGVALATIGLYFLTSPSGGNFNGGDALTLLCALMFALYIVYLDAVPFETDKIQMTGVIFLVCGVLGLACSAVLGEFDYRFSGNSLAGLLYLVVFATVITMWIQNRFQGETTPTRAAVIFAMEPVVAGVFAYFVRDEQLGMVGILGGVLILAGLLVSEFSESIPLLARSAASRESASR